MNAENKVLADALRAIISKTPNTQELYPLLCAIAEVAHELYPTPPITNEGE